jgi:hypothetical protein
MPSGTLQGKSLHGTNVYPSVDGLHTFGGNRFRLPPSATLQIIDMRELESKRARFVKMSLPLCGKNFLPRGNFFCS